MEQREQFIADYRRGLYDMSELCARYAVSRKTGYKWVARADAGGRAALRDRSRAPHHGPHRIPEDVAARICAARQAHPSWGPRLLLQWLAPRAPHVAWPAPSTAGDLLARRGLVKKRRRRRAPYYQPGVVAPVSHAPNDRWTADFKGHCRTRDGRYCYPLTVADLHSRYLLACQGLLTTKGVGVRAAFERTFREFGLPRAIRTDNGVPFAAGGLHGLTQLNVWWLRLGIQHQRIRPASPQENAVHGRMHRTLKAGAIRPPRGSRAAQQRAFNVFREEFNTERPHQALRGRRPAQLYRPSPRPFPAQLPPIEYPGPFLVKRVTNAGTFRFQHKLLFIANPLKQQHIGLEEVDNGIWSIYFNHVLLARLDERDYVIRG